MKAPDKAEAFKRALGYDLSNGDALIENVWDNINKYPIDERETNQYGRLFSITMRLKGPNGKTASVLASWIDDFKEQEVRLTSIYVVKKEAGG